MRCPRCDACQSQWSEEPCTRCGFPNEEKRTPEVVVRDDNEMIKKYGED